MCWPIGTKELHSKQKLCMQFLFQKSFFNSKALVSKRLGTGQLKIILNGEFKKYINI